MRLCEAWAVPYGRQEVGRLNKTNRGFASYVIILITFVIIALLLNGSLNTTVSKRIEYP